IAVALLPASPTTTTSPSASRISRTPSRRSAWSSTSTTLIRSAGVVISAAPGLVALGPPARQRHPQPHAGAVPGLAHEGDRPRHRRGAFLHGAEPGAAGRAVLGIEPDAVVGDARAQFVRRHVD